jgi:PAS domain S-box-containing protein
MVTPPMPEGQTGFEAVLRDAPFGVLIVERPGTVLWANPAYWEVSGRDPKLIGANILDVLQREEVEHQGSSHSADIRRAIAAALETGTPSTIHSVVPAHSRGDKRYIADVEVRAATTPPGQPPRAIVVVTVANDRFEDRLRSRVFYQAFVTCTIPLAIFDTGGTFLEVNPAFEAKFGFSRPECLGHGVEIVWSPSVPLTVREQMWAALRDPAAGTWSGEVMHRDKGGVEHPVLLAMSASTDDRGRPSHFLSVAVDLTEKRWLERSAAHAERLASLGRLAAGVAHEVNTPLANITLVAESLQRRSTDAWVRSRAATITEQVEAASKIVRSLLDFSRRADPTVSKLDLSDVARDALVFVQGKQSSDVEVEAVYPSAPVEIHGDRGQLIQVLSNLVNNAYDAMAGKGRLRMEVRLQEGRGIVEVTDSGPGIPVDILPHIFEPFFTTKPEGEGTGLGLAICHGIVLAHHGEITAGNVPGGGACFRVLLPSPGTPSYPAARTRIM